MRKTFALALLCFVALASASESGAAATSGNVYALFNRTCTADFLSQVNCHTVLTNPAVSLKNLVVNVCFRYVMNVENIIKPDTCIYSGFYAMRYIKVACQKGQSLKTYAANYCKALPYALYQRTQFTRKMWQMVTKGINTIPYCTSQMKGVLQNQWFSPYVPSHLLSFYTVCKTYDSVIRTMMKKGYTIWRFAIIYIYEVTFQLLLNVSEQLLFKTCIPAQIVSAPTGFCNSVIQHSTIFTFMNPSSQGPICKAAAQNVKAHCTGRPCFPCGLVLAVVYSNYNTLAHSLLHGLYKSITGNVALLLKTPNPYRVIGAPLIAKKGAPMVQVPGVPVKPAAGAKKAGCP